ncbi:hypothetical protein AGDE_15716 [Angomonas deanei]|nr:hypothetical protein AGDE_15716 [Angomonas deanei]|eukprot:EPY18585.1 hypothetical protein AGDE_15716 [Angomonas deanei]
MPEHPPVNSGPSASPQGDLSSSNRVVYPPELKKAARTALLFAVESPPSLEEISELYYSVHAQHDSPSPILHHHFLKGRPDMLLSSKVVYRQVRALLEQEDADPSRRSTRWLEALSLLDSVPPTPTSQSLRIGVLKRHTSSDAVLQALLESYHGMGAVSEAEVQDVLQGWVRWSKARLGEVRRLSRQPRRGALFAVLEREDLLCHFLRDAVETKKITFSTAVPINTALQVLRYIRDIVQTDLHRLRTNAGDPREIQVQEANLALVYADAEDLLQAFALPPSSTGKPLANNVTLYAVCRLFPPEEAFRWYHTIRSKLGDGVPLSEDPQTLEEVLQLCVTTGRWGEALRVLDQCREECARGGPHSVKWNAFLNSREELSSALLTLLNRHLPSPEHAVRALTGASEDTYLHLSKHYNQHIVHRAVNALLQSSITVKEAEQHVATLTGSNGDQQQKPSLGQNRSHRLLPLSEAIETESYVQLISLYSRENHWSDALTILHHLLPSTPGSSTSVQSKHHRTFVPTATVHDTVQCGLLQASGSPGAPSWETAVRLFVRMTEEENVPVSTVAFQSVLQLCAAQGAHHARERMLQLLVKKGVGRR